MGVLNTGIRVLATRALVDVLRLPGYRRGDACWIWNLKSDWLLINLTRPTSRDRFSILDHNEKNTNVWLLLFRACAPQTSVLTKIFRLRGLNRKKPNSKQGSRSMGTGRNDIFVEEKSKMGTENGYMPYMEMKVTWLDLLPVRRASGQRARVFWVLLKVQLVNVFHFSLVWIIWKVM